MKNKYTLVFTIKGKPHTAETHYVVIVEAEDKLSALKVSVKTFEKRFNSFNTDDILGVKFMEE